MYRWTGIKCMYVCVCVSHDDRWALCINSTVNVTKSFPYLVTTFVRAIFKRSMQWNLIYVIFLSYPQDTRPEHNCSVTEVEGRGRNAALWARQRNVCVGAQQQQREQHKKPWKCWGQNHKEHSVRLWLHGGRQQLMQHSERHEKNNNNNDGHDDDNVDNDDDAADDAVANTAGLL